MCHKYGHANHFAKDCLVEVPPKQKVKDSAYYARRAQELAESEKAFVTTMAPQEIECDEGYWSSIYEREDEVDKPNYYYMAMNDPPGRSIIQQLKL